MGVVMFLALKEMRRAKARFGLLIAVTGLLMFLILTLQTFRVGLVTEFVGAIQHQSAPVLVYNVEARHSIEASSIPVDMEASVRSSQGDANVGRIGQAVVPVLIERNGKSSPISTMVSIIGYEKSLGAPTEVVAGRVAQAAGEGVAGEDEFKLGDRVVVMPGGAQVTIVGLTARSKLFAAGLFTSYDTYLGVVMASNPDATTPRPNVLAIRSSTSTSDASVVRSLNGLRNDIDAMTRGDAAESNPAVRSVTKLFNSLLPIFGSVVPLVAGVFFVIITAQKANSLTLLRAIGATSRRLVESLLFQVLVILASGLSLGVGLYTVFVTAGVAPVPITFQPLIVGVWTAVLIVAGLLSSLFAARQVLRIDPLAATIGAGVGR
jgi:putative ABC transport system permease protein